MEKRFHVVYDVLNDGLGVVRLLPLLGILSLGLAMGVAALLYALRRRRRHGAVAAIVWLCVWGIVASIGFGNIFYHRWRCLLWAQSGDYDVVQGEVRHFVALPRHARESFTVGGITFSYSTYDSTHGGFNIAASHGGPIRERLYVRISHRDGQILKIEVAE